MKWLVHDVTRPSQSINDWESGIKGLKRRVTKLKRMAGFDLIK